MLHKRYFVALLCGALCLVGCLKNEESPSVTQVRNAKANELNAQADLLKAQANAQTVLAAAEAKLKEAQAELEKANAKKVAAEAQLLEVEAELRSVEVELARVNVDQAKVELEMRKVELDRLRKELEVAIAEANNDLARIAQELVAIQASMEVDAINQQLALLQAEDALNAYLEGLDEAEQEAFEQAVYMYFRIQRAILEAQIQINEDEIEIAKLEAQEEASYDQLIEDYNKANIELARLDAVLAKAQEYLEYTEDELEDARTEVRILLIDAQNAYLAAETALAEHYYTVYQPASNAVTDTYYYEYQRRDYDFAGVFNYLEGLGADWEYMEVDEDGDWGYQWGYYDEEGEWVVLHNEQYTHYEFVAYQPDQATLDEYDEKGIFWPDDALYEWGYVRVPAQTNVEAVNAFIDEKVANVKEAAEEAKAEAKELADETAENWQYWVDYTEATIAKTQEYVDGLKETFDAADKAVEDAVADLEEKLNAWYDAMDAVDIAEIDNAEWQLAKAEYEKACNETIEAWSDLNDAQLETEGAEIALAEEEGKFIAWYGGADMEEAKFNRDMAIATATNDVKVKKAAVTDAIVKAYTDAQAATVKAKDDVKTAEATLKDKQAALRAAQVALAGDPTNETLIKAEADAQKAVTDAETDLTTKQAAVVTAEGNEATAKANYDAVNDPYEAAVAALEELQGKADEFAEAIAAAEDDLKVAQAAEELAQAAYDAAEEAEEAASDAFDEATEALAADEKAALVEADEAKDEAFDAYWEAKQTVWDLEYIYDHYRSDVAALCEEEGNEGWLIENLAYYSEGLATLAADYDGDGLAEPYEEYIASIDDFVAEFEADAEEVKATVKQFDEQYRPAYVEAIEAFNAADATYNELEFAAWDAEAVVDYYMEIYEMLGACVFADEEGNIVSVEEYIAEIQAQIDEIVDAFNAEYEAYMYGYDNIYAINRLELEIEQLQTVIEILTAQLEKYEAIINEHMAE